MSYRAPVEDILATMRHVAGLDALISEGLAPELADGVTEAVLEEAAKFAGDVLAPLNVVGDRIGSKLKDGTVVTPPGWKEAYHAWAQGGWNALPGPEAYGGQALPTLVQSACTEMWNSAAFAFALGPLLIMLFGFLVSTRFRLNSETHAVLMEEIERFKTQPGTEPPATSKAVVEDLTGWKYEELWGRGKRA